MGFETEEEAERWAETSEFLADKRCEDRLLPSSNECCGEAPCQWEDHSCYRKVIHDPKELAWERLTKLAAYADIPESARLLQRAVFDYAWEAATVKRTEDA